MKRPNKKLVFTCPIDSWANIRKEIRLRRKAGWRIVFTHRGVQVPTISWSQLFREGMPDLRKHRQDRVVVTRQRQPIGLLRPPDHRSLRECPSLKAEFLVIESF